MLKYVLHLDQMACHHNIEVFMKKTICLFALILFLVGCDKVDKCLDSGGRWNYEKKVCEYSDTEN